MHTEVKEFLERVMTEHANAAPAHGYRFEQCAVDRCALLLETVKARTARDAWRDHNGAWRVGPHPSGFFFTGSEYDIDVYVRRVGTGDVPTEGVGHAWIAHQSHSPGGLFDRCTMSPCRNFAQGPRLTFISDDPSKPPVAGKIDRRLDGSAAAFMTHIEQGHTQPFDWCGVGACTSMTSERRAEFLRDDVNKRHLPKDADAGRTPIEQAWRSHIDNRHGEPFGKCNGPACSTIDARARDEFRTNSRGEPMDAVPPVGYRLVAGGVQLPEAYAHHIQTHGGTRLFDDCRKTPCMFWPAANRREWQGGEGLTRHMIEQLRGDLDALATAGNTNVEMLLKQVNGVTEAHNKLVDQVTNGGVGRETFERTVAALHDHMTEIADQARRLETSGKRLGELDAKVTEMDNVTTGDRLRLKRVDEERYETASEVDELKAAVEAITVARRTANAAELMIERDGLPLRFTDADDIAAAVYGRLRAADAFVLDDGDDEGWSWARAGHHVSVAAVLARMYNVATAREDEARLWDKAGTTVAGFDGAAWSNLGTLRDDGIKLRDVEVRPTAEGLEVHGLIPASPFADSLGTVIAPGAFSFAPKFDGDPVTTVRKVMHIGSDSSPLARMTRDATEAMTMPAKNEIRGSEDWHNDRGHKWPFESCIMNACKRRRDRAGKDMTRAEIAALFDIPVGLIDDEAAKDLDALRRAERGEDAEVIEMIRRAAQERFSAALAAADAADEDDDETLAEAAERVAHLLDMQAAIQDRAADAGEQWFDAATDEPITPTSPTGDSLS